MALDLSTLTAQQQLAAIYIGYYDRAADPVGEDFWESAVANPNLSLADIATDFATQPETLIAYPFLDDPTVEEAEGFIAEVFLNLFNRAPDQAGLDFWSDALVGAINGTNSLSVGEIILSIIGGAQNSAEGNDLTTILNKIEVATTWTDAADAAGIDYTSNTAAQNSAKSIIEGVTDVPATVVAAKETIDGFFGETGGVEGETYKLTSATDDITGTADDDEFMAYIQQNPFAGGVSNSLSSADRLDGGAGNDRLYAELSFEFLGTNNIGVLDNQPEVTNIEEIDIEARDFGFDYGFFGGPGGFYGGEDDDYSPNIIVDAKEIKGHNEIGSYFSDGDLTIENLTTLTAGDVARNTSEITITMDHTDNFNTDGDASDLKVLFDNDYLLSGQEQQGQIFYFLLDQNAEEDGLDQRLFNIDVDGIRFTIDTGSGPVDVVLDDIAANVAGTHQGFVNALQPALQALIADGTLPAGTTLTLDPTITDFTFLDDGTRSEDIPAIVLTSGDGSPVIATGFSRIEEPIGAYNVYGDFNSVNEIEDQPISVDLDLHKAGRGGEGGDVIIGAKSADGSDDTTADGIADGIEVININVKGAGNDDPDGGMTKPSNVGTITSTGNELRQVFIATDPMFAQGSTFASLTVRNGFDEDISDDEETGDLELINADAFLGDLTLGDLDANRDSGRITNADTITAQGGGDVTLGLYYDGSETDQAYSVTTGGGNDDIDIDLDGDALDYANSSLNVSTGGGDDSVRLDMSLTTSGTSEEELNQAILDNVLIETGAGDDFVDLNGSGVANIDTGAGDDTIFTDGDTSTAAWVFNFDAERVQADGFDINGYSENDFPGEQVSLAYIGGATVTVTLSGAGVNGAFVAGGGVMAMDDDDAAAGANAFEDGYEASVQINNLINGNDYYGDQRDINAAIIEAIENDPILSQLLTVEITANNTLRIDSTTTGQFSAEDLRIEIERPDLTNWTPVQTEARSVFSNSLLVVNSVVSADAPTGQVLESSAGADAWYDGLSADADPANSTTAAVGEFETNLYSSGSDSNNEVDTVIEGGAGDDLIVLSTDHTENLPSAFTVSSNNAFLNGASNETIVLAGNNFGNDTVMNFTTSGDEMNNDQVTPDDSDVGFDAVAGYEGMDFLDFTAYLTSEESSSGSTVSETVIPVTLDYGTDADGASAAANEVIVVRYTDDAGDPDTFASLSAADIAALYNNTADYDNGALAQGNFTAPNDANVVGGNAKAVLMVENAGNLGEYKVFELSWNAGTDTPVTDVSVNALGSLDFGDSLGGLAEVNLVGSEDYNDLLSTGFGVGL